MKSKLLTSAAAAVTLALSAGAAFAADPSSKVSDWEALFAAPQGVQAGAGAEGGAGGGGGAPQFGGWGFDAAGVNAQAKPGDSFFDYASGAWYAKTEIPGDRSSFGMFDVIYDKSQEQLRSIIEDTAKAGGAADTTPGKVGALYNAFMDEARLEQLDAAPLAGDLRRIRDARTRNDLAAYMGGTAGGFGSSFFGGAVFDDAKNPKMNALYLFQGGLSLPDRDYYLSDTFKEKKAKYRDYVARQLAMVGWEDAGKRADEIVAMETRIAEASWTRAESRDDDKTYNPMTVAELERYAPGFPWKAWFKGAGAPTSGRVIVGQNTAFPKIAKVFAETPIETLKAWQAFSVIDQASPYLSKRFVNARFDFRNRTLNGQTEQRPRWKRGVQLVDGSLGEAVGQVYVQRYFPAESKAKMDVLVADLKTAMGERIQKLTWMGPETKAKALAKLGTFRVKIGYPDKWRSYDGLAIDAGDLYGDVQRSSAFEWKYNLSKLGKPVDKDEWGMTPQTVNAYYSSTKNEIVFPAAILQAPFFDPNADPAVNYGGIGGVIGHEITHGFDDQGRKSDADGSLRDWWTAEDAKKFQVQADRLGAQYDSYEVGPGVKVKGAQTMGENIADLGGILLGLDAYHASLKGQPAPVLDGVTGDQRVFYGWAQVWREKARQEALEQQVVSDVHSPARFRVDGPVRNVDAWYDAFGVKEGDKLYIRPEDRVRIW
jgi:putative endopeptidase